MKNRRFISFAALLLLLAPVSAVLAQGDAGSDTREGAAPDKKGESRPERRRENVQKRIQIVRDEEIYGGKDSGPGVGSDAPDFTLTPLKFYDFQVEDEEVTQQNAHKLFDKIQLSGFQGKRPVALIFGSYT